MPGPGQQAPGAARNGTGNRGSRSPARSGVGAMAGPGVTGTAGTASMGAVAGVAGAQQARPGYTPTGAKIGRNDACWCGSGRKYKKCHGS
jgi:hypothetical protein